MIHNEIALHLMISVPRMRRDTSPKKLDQRNVSISGFVKRFFDGRRQDQEELHTRADAAHGAASRERYTSAGSMPQAGDHRKNLLQVEAAGGGHGGRGADSAATVGGQKQKVEALVG
jgi:hypothetical protein